VPLAAFWPDRVRRLALVSCALGDRRSLAEIAAAVDVPQKKIFSAAGDPLPVDAQLLVSHFGMVHPEPISAEGNASRKRADHWIQPSERGVAITDLRGTLKRVEAPTLLLYGDKDHAYLKFRVGAEAALKHSVTKFVPNSGAFVMQDNPAPTAAILNQFLNES
jgi:pimeloyl-ACP methyl ester carboxylesterase